MLKLRAGLAIVAATPETEEALAQFDALTPSGTLDLELLDRQRANR